MNENQLLAFLASDVKTIEFYKIGEHWIPSTDQVQDLVDILDVIVKDVDMMNLYNMNKKENEK